MLIDIQKQKEYEDELKKKVEERMKSDSIWKGKGDAGNNIGKRLPDYPSPKIKLTITNNVIVREYHFCSFLVKSQNYNT